MSEPNNKKLLETIDKMLVAKPFVPFRVRCGATEFKITEPSQARFNCFGSVEIRTIEVTKHILFNDHINLVEPL